MTARILDGKKAAQTLRAEAAAHAARLKEQGITPSLVVVLAGDNPASAVYVRNKATAAGEAGIAARTLRFDASLSETELLGTIHELNADDTVDAILVQLPLPAHISTQRVLEAVVPAKDVDGFHPLNAGKLLQGQRGPVPCTPAGIMDLLRLEGIDPKGMRATVIGRSDIVGKPMALLLMHAHATVTIAHSRTRDLAGVCREADLLVAALGKPGLVTADFVKPGAIVIDVGINRVDSRAEVERLFGHDEKRLTEFDRKGSVLAGDCEWASVVSVASAVTPVPGGVGPLTIARLLKNTVELAESRRLSILS